jgi:hypothetical protein
VWTTVDYGIPFNEHWWDWIRYHWFNPWWKPGIWRGVHKVARDDNADFFCSLVDVYGTIPFHLTGTAKVTWRLFGFNVHNRELNCLCGIEGLVYHNVSKKLDALRKDGFMDRSHQIDRLHGLLEE